MCRKYEQNIITHNNVEIADCMKTKAYRKKLTPDLESVAKNYTESVKKSHATENEKKKIVDQCNVRFVSPNKRKKKLITMSDL